MQSPETKGLHTEEVLPYKQEVGSSRLSPPTIQPNPSNDISSTNPPSTSQSVHCAQDSGRILDWQERFPLWSMVRLSEAGRKAYVDGPRGANGMVSKVRGQWISVLWGKWHSRYGRVQRYLPEHLERVDLP